MPTNPKPKPKRRNPFQVVTPSTNPASTQVLSPSNGMYLTPVTVGNPATAAIGGTGSFGALNPVAVSTGYDTRYPGLNAPGTGSFLAAQGSQALGVQTLNKPATPKGPTQPLVASDALKYANMYSPPQQVSNPGFKDAKGVPASVKLQQKNTNMALKDFESFSDMVEMDIYDFNLLPSELDMATVRAMMKKSGMTIDDMKALGYAWNADNTAMVNTFKNPDALGAAGGTGTTASTGGAAPFGANAAGQRLDASGNVWDPNTATRDIYGGRFIQEGETRWERNKNGRLIKVKYLSGNRKVEMNKGKAKRQQAQQQAQQQNNSASNTSSVSGNFNTATG